MLLTGLTHSQTHILRTHTFFLHLYNSGAWTRNTVCVCLHMYVPIRLCTHLTVWCVTAHSHLFACQPPLMTHTNTLSASLPVHRTHPSIDPQHFPGVLYLLSTGGPGAAQHPHLKHSPDTVPCNFRDPWDSVSFFVAYHYLILGMSCVT